MEELQAEVQRLNEDLATAIEQINSLNTKIDNKTMQLEYPPTEQDSLVIKEVAGTGGGSYIWGDIAADGTAYTISSGVTSTRTSTGNYTINHAIGKTICITIPNYPADSAVYNLYTTSYNDNVITLSFTRNSVAYNTGFYFIAFPQT